MSHNRIQRLLCALHLRACDEHCPVDPHPILKVIERTEERADVFLDHIRQDDMAPLTPITRPPFSRLPEGM